MTDRPEQHGEWITVHPFVRQHEGGEVVIGRQDGSSFLALPPDAVEILDHLAAGGSVGEARRSYRETYGEEPNVDGLLDVLEAEGFVSREGAEQDAPAGGSRAGLQSPELKPRIKSRARRFHFNWFPRPLAEAIFSTPVFIAGGGIVALALLAIAADPSFMPGPRALYFSHKLGTMVFWLAVLVAMQVAIHETAHLIGAKARGVPVRFGWGTRLWLIVLETDMSGVWTIPRRKRYLPILAGPFVDAVTGSLLILLLAAEARGLVALSPVALGISRAMVIVYIYQLLWQCFFFVRTDFYYVVASYFGCKNLMGDTVAQLRNLWARLRGKEERIDLSFIPEAELRVVRGYSAVWLAGRVLALSLLVFIQIPLIFSYLKLMGRSTVNLVSGGPVASPTLLVPVLIALVLFLVGMFLWLRNLRDPATSTVGAGPAATDQKESSLP